MTGDDPFHRLDYRRFVAWESRIERELPFLVDLFARPGPLPLLDAGCGTGEHAAALASRGYRVIGIDRSANMIGKAAKTFDGPRFLRGDLRRLPFPHRPLLAGAICLGNTLVNLTEDEDYLSFFGSLRALLPEGAPLLIQIVNYHRILEKGIRHLPLNFRAGDDGEILFLRLLDPIDGKRMRFELLTIERRPPRGESRIARALSTVLRPLRHGELTALLGGAGFSETRLFGDYGGGDYDPLRSTDVIAVAR